MSMHRCNLTFILKNYDVLGILRFRHFNNCVVITINTATGIAQSVQRLATGWSVRGSSPDGGEIFRTRPDRSWGPPSLLYNGYRVFPGGKADGAWC